MSVISAARLLSLRLEKLQGLVGVRRLCHLKAGSFERLGEEHTQQRIVLGD